MKKKVGVKKMSSKSLKKNGGKKVPKKESFSNIFTKKMGKKKIKWREGKKNPSHYLSRHALPLRDLPKELRKESNEFEKMV